MRISLVQKGLLKPGALEAWSRKKQKAIRAAVKTGLNEARPRVKQDVQGIARARFRVMRAGFIKSFSARLLDKQPGRLPALLVGSRIPWTGIHERGGVLRAKGRGLLIPLNTRGGRRIGRKAFKAIVDRLLQQGNAFFKQVNGKVILFAEALGESQLGKFRKSGEAFSRFGGVRGKRGKSATEVPIAILLPSVRLRARLGLAAAVRNKYLKWITQAIQQRLNRD